jgi:ACS family glucarate transporter-like MFS transporter
MRRVPRPEPSGRPVNPTHARRTVTIFAVALAIITYIDRVCIAQAAPAMRREMGLTAIEMGWAFTTFTWAYAMFEVPGGWLGDKIGARRVLMRIVLWWSFFTAATGWVWNLTSLLVTRALFGVGEAGAFPNLTRAFTTWLPAVERERAQAILWMSARWGGAFTPLLVAFILDVVSWRRAFEIFGALGVVWAVWFFKWYRDDPSTHPGVNAAELAIIPPASETAPVHGPTPWRLMLRSPSVLLLWAQYVCFAYGWWFYVTWLPTYLQDERGLDPKRGALLASLPLLLGGVGCLVSSRLSRRLSPAMGVARARRLLAIVGFLAAAVALELFTRIEDPTLAMLMLGVAGFFGDFVMPPAWTACMDLGGRYAGTISGGMNMAGSVAGGCSPLVVGYLLEWTGNWLMTFYITAVIYLMGAVCWLFLDSYTPFAHDEHRARHAPSAVPAAVA